MLALLFTGLLAGFGLLPVIFASIHHSRALDGFGRAGKAVLNTAQDAPLLAVVGSALICSIVALSWLYWASRDKYVWPIDCALM